MKNLLSFLFLFILANSFAQLDPFYFGTYRSANALEKYTIYSMDEIEEDCFIVEYDRFQDAKVVEHWGGYGHCDGDGLYTLHFDLGITHHPYDNDGCGNDDEAGVECDGDGFWTMYVLRRIVHG
jgi:hypothetical protein